MKKGVYYEDSIAFRRCSQQKCINDCQFCVSKMHTDQYKNQMDDNLPFFDLYLKDYLERLEFARHNGCNTVMLTGNSEPQQNRKFLTR